MSDITDLQTDIERIFEPEILKIQATIEDFKLYIVNWFQAEQEPLRIKDTESKKNR